MAECRETARGRCGLRARRSSRRGGPATPGRRFRGLGRGRATRRALTQGGTGAAFALNDALGAWADVRITPMFGRWGYFAGSRLFACFPLRPKEHDLWIRLPGLLQQRALAADPAVRPHRRFGRRGWIEVDVVSGADVARALRWLKRAHAAARAAGAPEDDDDE